MTDVTCIGLGNMGSALAKALVRGGQAVTVWNRSSAKASAVVALGAIHVGSIVAAVRSSPTLIVCVDNYESTRSLFSPGEVSDLLAGRTVIQFSTGTPKEAREAEAWFGSKGAEYLDGALMVFPEEIGTPNALIMVAGSKSAYDQDLELLGHLGENLRYIGANIAAAAALDMAILAKVLGQTVGAVHAARVCEAEGVSVDTLASMLSDNDDVKGTVQAIHTSNFGNPGATIEVWNHAVHRILLQSRDAEINRDVPEFISELFKRAIAMGHDQEHIAALIKVLRAS